MRNILAAELLKLKRSKLIPVCTLIALVVPVFMIILDAMDKVGITADMEGCDWLIRLIIPIQMFIYPILSGFIITFLIQKEYVERTMLNTLTAPVNRTKLILSKFVIWMGWHLLVSFLFFIILCLGFLMIYGGAEFQSTFATIVFIVFGMGILGFLSMSPILIICISQKNVFYPSLLCSCGVAALEFAGLYMFETMRNLIPWTAVTSISILGCLQVLPVLSVLICFVIGIMGASVLFRRQNI